MAQLRLQCRAQPWGWSQWSEVGKSTSIVPQLRGDHSSKCTAEHTSPTQMKGAAHTHLEGAHEGRVLRDHLRDRGRVHLAGHHGEFYLTKGTNWYVCVRARVPREEMDLCAVLCVCETKAGGGVRLCRKLGAYVHTATHARARTAHDTRTPTPFPPSAKLGPRMCVFPETVRPLQLGR